MLRDLNLMPVYDSAECDLVLDLIAPLLAQSQEYWRGVGFFTSGWLRTACAGIVSLVGNSGSARIVTSPIMERNDWDALQVGDAAKRDAALRDVLREQVSDLPRALSRDTLDVLAWMVADGILEFRFAIPRDFRTGGDYHDKVGVFADSSDDVVAIHGSFNDSAKGSLNGEAFSVFTSWNDGQRPYVEQHRARLAKLWLHGNTQFQVLPLPAAIRDQIVRLRTGSRPYSSCHNPVSTPSVETSQPEQGIRLRPYQQEAITAWKTQNCRGIFEMATGTGKTFTALAAAMDRSVALERIAVIVLVPYLHLLEQWRQHCEEFGFFPILCSGNHPDWPKEVRSKKQDFRLGALPSMCILAVHQTASTDRFAKAVAGLSPETTLVIADEVHGLGAPRLRNALVPFVDMRLGLSATPRRWYDEEGTNALLSFFSGICFEYPLDQAIGTALTPYRYLPILTHFTNREMDAYEDLSRSIAALSCRDFEREPGLEERLKKLLLRRAQLVSAAENKLPLLLNKLRALMRGSEVSGTELKHVLVYCAPGTHSAVLSAVASLGLRCHEFVHTVTLDNRQKVLCQFADGDIQVLVAIHCLDEGVDIPATKTAFFLASTTNPKEFVQRRGRILRKAKGKTHADVLDFVVVPTTEHAHLRREADLSLLRREMPRFAEFAASASNEFEARATLRDILDAFEMLHLLDLKPWDIYHQVMESVEIKDRS
ncbi:MAG TPA: DNA repair helicase [Desulfofustis sp.]|jgi:superfamily II DNA or RNA helicase|nr:MAG: hypothetical protein N838_03460 [Thiohalocapsa sp. PB-PSB1]MBL0381417.1 DEAD/DEAH box helicase family protein [Desulfofustis sp. PB-SRB1]HBH29941.1 DNA repair helicase [Desulfofustis sp.]